MPASGPDPTGGRTVTVTGVSADTARAAVETTDPLPGTAGFAGRLDGRLVRDVLGRYPLFFEPGDTETWSHDPEALVEPQRLPAGHVHDGTGGSQRLWALPTRPPVDDDDAAVAAVREAVDTAVSTVTDAGGDLAVAFSGGIDSGLLAARLDAPLYTVGFPDSHDLEAARSGAALLGRELRVVELDHAALERAVPQVAAATGRTNAMDVQITLPLFILAQQVAADGFDRLALGQGADELFGGYAKVEQAPDDDRVAADTVRGARDEMLRTVPDQFERDRLALSAAGVEPVAPLAHDRVVEAALGLGGEQLVRSGTRKWALRRAADPWLPDPLPGREKKALQYGTLAARELDRLARQAGYKRRMDSHVDQYIESLL